MSKTKEQKAKEKADKKAAKQAAKETTATPSPESEVKTQPKEKSAAQKKRDEEKAKKAYLKEPLTSVQQNKLINLGSSILALRTEPNTTVGDLQAAIPEYEKILDELKI